MARPLRIEYPGAFYHIISRGNEKGKIFSSDGDRYKFLHYIKTTHDRFGLLIHAYCLMANHYHLLCETPQGNLARSMQFLNSGYTTYYNIKRDRSGHLFEGRYKSILVEKDSYLRTLTRYIHLNPVKAKLVKKPQQYRWSSYRSYIGLEKVPSFLSVKLTLEYFDKDKEEFRKFVEQGISLKTESPLTQLKAGFILGNENFVKKIKNKYLKSVEASRDLPSLRQLKKQPVSASKILGILRNMKSIKEKERMQLSAYFLRKYTGATLYEILQKLYEKKKSISAVSQIISRAEKKRLENVKMGKKLKEIEAKILNV